MLTAPFTPISDIYLEPFSNAPLEHHAIVARAQATADKANTGTWPCASENFCVAIDEAGNPGFLLIAPYQRDNPPGAHILVRAVVDIGSEELMPDARTHYLAPGEYLSDETGPAMLIFIPGVDWIDPKVERVFDRVWVDL